MDELSLTGQYAWVAELHLEVHYGVDLAAEAEPLGVLCAALADLGFGSQVRVLTHEGDRRSVDVDLHDLANVHRVVVEKGCSRGPVFDGLSAASPPTHARRFGDVMLRGRLTRTWVTVRFDEYRPAMPMGDKWLFSNTTSVNTAKRRVGSVASHEWIRALLHKLVANDSVVWGAAWDVDEFHARNLHDEDDGVWALGRDMRRALPGLFWLNAFGPAYVELIGRDVLTSAPVENIVELGASIVMELYSSPHMWATEAAQDARNQVLAHIDRRYFYDRQVPDRHTIAPDFGLPELPAHGGTFGVVTTDGKTFTVLPRIGS